LCKKNVKLDENVYFCRLKEIQAHYERRKLNINEHENADQQHETENGQKIISVSGMYKDWFLDYASYVILERRFHISKTV